MKTMFYTDLKNIYSHKKFLEKKFPFNQYYPLLQLFIVEELKSQAEFINPYRFSLHYGKPLKETLNFFIGLSGENGIFTRWYKVECDCGEYLFFREKEKSHICDYCYSNELFINENFSNVELHFRLNEEVIKEMNDQIKKAQSSSEAGLISTHNSEEGAQSVSPLNLESVLNDKEIINENDEIEPMKDFLLDLMRSSIGAT